MGKLFSVISLFSVVFLLIFSARADDFENQRPFNERELNAFIADWPEFVTWTRSKGENLNRIHSPTELAASKHYFDMQRFLERINWKPKRFFYILNHVGKGLAMLQTENVDPEMIAKLEAQKAMIEQSTMFTSEQKKVMLGNLKQAFVQARKIESGREIPSVELELITEKRETLMRLLSEAGQVY